MPCGNLFPSWPTGQPSGSCLEGLGMALISIMGVWQGVAIYCLKYHQGRPCPTHHLRVYLPLKRPFGCSSGGHPQGRRPVGVFYRLGHPRPCTSASVCIDHPLDPGIHPQEKSKPSSSASFSRSTSLSKSASNGRASPGEQRWELTGQVNSIIRGTLNG
jgi:hypothetical protein